MNRDGIRFQGHGGGIRLRPANSLGQGRHRESLDGGVVDGDDDIPVGPIRWMSRWMAAVSESHR